MGTWQRRVDPLAASYLSTALQNFRQNLANPETATNESAIATTFMLAMLEVCLIPACKLTSEIFNASTSRWRHHLRGAAQLIRYRGGAADIHPDIKRNMFMLDLQSALNVGEGFFYDSQQWMDEDIDRNKRELDERPDWPISTVEPGRREACIIDPILGTSSKLLSVMVCLTTKSYVNCTGKSSETLSVYEKCESVGHQRLF
jgi:hypothetical protein